MGPVNQKSARGAGLSTPSGTVSTRGMSVFVLGFLDLFMYGMIYDPRMETYRPRVRRDLDSVPGAILAAHRLH